MKRMLFFVPLFLCVMAGKGCSLARADSFQATGQTDKAECAAQSRTCSEILYNFNFTTDAPTDPFGAIQRVWSRGGSFTGEINGVTVFGTGISLVDSWGTYVGPPLLDGGFT